MFKKITILVCSVLITSAAFSQSSGETPAGGFSVGLHAALPMGTFGDFYSFGAGGSLQYAIGLAPSLEGFVQAGYTNFFGKTYDVFGTSVKAPSSGIITGLVGAKYYVAEQFGVGLGIGYGHVSSDGASSGGFHYSPMLTYKLNPVAINLSYNGLSADGGTSSWIGLGVSYAF
jgi:hypothetical protein